MGIEIAGIQETINAGFAAEISQDVEQSYSVDYS